MEVGKIIPYSFSKIRQEQEELQQVNQDVDLCFDANRDLDLNQLECEEFVFEPVKLEGEELDPLSSSLSHLDLLDTVLADFTRGKFKSCDKPTNYNVIDEKSNVVEDLEPLIDAIPVQDVNWIDSGVENLPITDQSNIVSSIDSLASDIDSQGSMIDAPKAYVSALSEHHCDEVLNIGSFGSTIVHSSQSRLSDSFCDEIFTELEKTATFPRQIDWIDAFTGDSNEFKQTEVLENENSSTKDDWKDLYDLNANNKSFEAFEDIPEKHTIEEKSTPPSSR